MRTEDGGTVVILCGGKGTRLQEHTRSIPKALVDVGGRPILLHVIDIYAAQGFDRFVLCVGHKGEMIEEAVGGEGWPTDVHIECVPTGEETPTGGRVLQVKDLVGPGSFCVTYADGVADIDLASLTSFHRDHGALATMTVVRPTLGFGVAELDADGRVTGFREKPRSEHWVNGGFFRFEQGVFDYLGGSSVLEREPLEGLASEGQLRAYRHTGFWDCMDTYKDALLLNELWASGSPPWRVRDS